MRYYFLLLTLILCLSVTHAHVIGIDFGSQYLKVAGPHSDQLMDIVLNELSKRKIDNYIGFRNGDRYIGEPAKVLAARFPLMTAAAVNQLLVLASNSTSLPQFLASKFEYAVDISDSRTHVPIGERFAPFSAVQLYSMFLSYAQKIARNDGVLDPQSVVVTVPYNTGSIERKVILDAATRYSGLNVLGLVHAPTAAAFYYGMRRRGFGNRTVTITVLDVGYTQTSAGVYRFTPAKNNSPMTNAFGTLTTIATSSDAFVGGRALDLCVAEFIEKKAMKEMNIGPVIGGKTAVQLKSQFSLLRAANKVREVLSVNSNTPYTVEGIVPERDFHSTITREVFEKECSGIFDRITKVAEEALQVSGMKPADLDAFELMGGTARTPKIISSISKALGREVDRTMNMEEAAAIGAGYIAAKLSPHYRAKSFQLQERLSDDIYFTVHPPVDSTKEGVKRNLFDTSNFIGRTVSVTLNRTDDFSLHLFEEPNAVTPFASIDVSGVRAALEKLKVFQPEIPHPNNSHIIRIQLSVNESELIEVSEVEAIARSAVNVTRKAPSNVNASNGTGETHYIRMRNANRPLKSSIVWWNAVVSSDVQQKELDDLRAIDAIELEKHLRSDAKNSLEAYLFWCRNEGIVENEELIAVVPSEEMDQFKTVLGEVSEWLDDGEGESDSCPTSLYKEKLQLLQQWAKKLKAAKTAQKGVEKGENSSDEDL